MDDPAFEQALKQAHRASLRAGVITIVGAVLLLGSAMALLWQFREVKKAKERAVTAEAAAVKLANQVHDLQYEVTQFSQDLGGKLKVAEGTIQSLRADLEAALRRAGENETALAASKEKYSEPLKGIEQFNTLAENALSSFKQRAVQIEQNPLIQASPEQRTIAPDPAPTTDHANVHVVVGDDTMRAKVMALAGQNQGFYRVTKVQVVKRVPPLTEVRYYHLPDDQEEARKILGDMRQRFGLKGGRISYVLDSSLPKRFFQVALAKDALP